MSDDDDDGKPLNTTPDHVKQLAAVAQAIRFSRSPDVAKNAQAFERSQNSLKYLSKNANSPKWPSSVCKLLGHTNCFHLEQVDNATRTAARGEMRCNLCGTREENCNIVVHLGGDIDTYRADDFFDADLKTIGGFYKNVHETMRTPNYLGVLVPGRSCLGLIVKTLTANNFIYNCIDRASSDLATDTLAVAKLWDQLTYTNTRNSEYFYRLVSKDQDNSDEFQIIFDSFVAGVVAKLPDNLDLREQWLSVFREGKAVTQSNLDLLSGAGSTSYKSRVEIEIDNTDDEDDEGDEDDEDAIDDFIVPDDEEEDGGEEEEDGGEEEDWEGQGVHTSEMRRPRRRVVESSDDEVDEERTRVSPVQMSVVMAVGEPLPPGNDRVTRSGKRQMEQKMEQQRSRRQRDLVSASAAPNRAAAAALRVHPDNPLHSRVSTLQDLLEYASRVAEDNSADAVTLVDAAAVITRLLDGKKRGIDYNLNISATSKALSQLQTRMVTQGRVSETSAVAAALLTLAEFAR